MKGPHRIETERLVLRRPAAADAEAIFARFAADPAVTKYMAWPTHTSIADTREFLAGSEAEWQQNPAGPYLIESRDSGELLGSTGLYFDGPDLAITGYVFAQDAWGQGFATEALTAMVQLAESLGVRRLVAQCHPDHARSAHVLEKCGFECEGLKEGASAYPNVPNGGTASLVYIKIFPDT